LIIKFVGCGRTAGKDDFLGVAPINEATCAARVLYRFFAGQPTSDCGCGVPNFSVNKAAIASTNTRVHWGGRVICPYKSAA